MSTMLHAPAAAPETTYDTAAIMGGLYGDGIIALKGAFSREWVQALREDVEAGIRPLLRANRDLERGLQVASVRATLPVFFPEDESKPWGYQEAAEWVEYGAWMRENGLLENDKALPDAALTNEFLAGQGLEQPPTEY